MKMKFLKISIVEIVKNILPNLFPNLLRIVFQWIYSQNDVGTMMFTLNDIFYFYCKDLKDEEDFKFIHELIAECMFDDKSKNSLVREMIKKYLTEEDEQAFLELIIQICIKNKEFLKKTLNELFDDFDSNSKTDKEKIIQFITMIINDYQNEFKGSIKDIDEQLSKFDYDENILKLKNSNQVL